QAEDGIRDLIVTGVQTCALPIWPDPPPERTTRRPRPHPDLADVRGHHLARLALEVSAAGGHHLLLVGPPGSGKTMLARRLPGLRSEERRVGKECSYRWGPQVGTV